MHQPYEILGQWHPDTTKWTARGNPNTYGFAAEMDWHEVPIPLRPHAWEIRSPQCGYSWRDPLRQQGTDGWHQDGNFPYLFVWSNIFPTELSLNGKLIVPEPGSVVVINNKVMKHRTPVAWLDQVEQKDLTDATVSRWFMRLHHYDDPEPHIAGWKRYLKERQS